MISLKHFILISRFFLVKFGPGKVFGDFLETKLAVLGHKKPDLKKSEILHCIVHVFDEKFEISLSFLLREIWPRKSVW